MKEIFYKFYNKYIRPHFECVRMYKIDIYNTNSSKTNIDINKYDFIIAGADTVPLHEKLLQYNADKLNIVLNRYREGNYQCFAYLDKSNGNLAYTRWICNKHYYSDVMKQDVFLNYDEVLTLDSWTNPDYRKQGLHRAMNYQMLEWLKMNTNYRYVYMVIMCFMPHLKKIPFEIGYRPIKTVFYRKSLQK